MDAGKIKNPINMNVETLIHENQTLFLFGLQNRVNNLEVTLNETKGELTRLETGKTWLNQVNEILDRALFESRIVNELNRIAYQHLCLEDFMSAILEFMSHLIPFQAAGIALFREGILVLEGHLGSHGNPANWTRENLKTWLCHIWAEQREERPTYSRFDGVVAPFISQSASAMGQIALKPFPSKEVAGVIVVAHQHENALGDSVGELTDLFARHLSMPLLRSLLYSERQKIAQERAQLIEQLERQQWHFRQMAVTDELTGLYNRHLLTNKLQEEFERALAEGRTMSIIILDVDFFKRINDTYGHPFGDMVLKQLAEILRKSVRRSDFLARYGGEEFVVVAPGANKEAAMEVCSRIQESLDKHCFEADGNKCKVTVSIGIATFPLEGIIRPEDLLLAADRALYKAKSSGRDTICVAPITD